LWFTFLSPKFFFLGGGGGRGGGGEGGGGGGGGGVDDDHDVLEAKDCCTAKAVCMGTLLWWSTQVLLHHLFGHFLLISTLSCLGGHNGTSH